MLYNISLGALFLNFLLSSTTLIFPIRTLKIRQTFKLKSGKLHLLLKLSVKTTEKSILKILNSILLYNVDCRVGLLIAFVRQA